VTTIIFIGGLRFSVTNSRSGRRLRLRGRGIPGDPPGDLFLELELVLPPANTDAAREFYRTMERQMKFNPRQTTERGP
jgi:curved DNA-binding protein